MYFSFSLLLNLIKIDTKFLERKRLKVETMNLFKMSGGSEEFSDGHRGMPLWGSTAAVSTEEGTGVRSSRLSQREICSSLI